MTPLIFGEPLRHRARSHLAAFARRSEPLAGRRAAAVSVVLLPDARGHAGILLTRRSATLRRHAHQWALPGGGVDDGERVEEAALRELREEVGLVLGKDAVLGVLDDYPTRSGFVITPLVLWGGPDAAPVPNPAEVASVHHLRLADLDGPDVPRFASIPESDRPLIQLPLFSTLIHAPTAAVLYQAREVLIHGRATRVAHFEQPVWAWS